VAGDPSLGVAVTVLAAFAALMLGLGAWAVARDGAES
jgi:hypothetical protein